MIKSLTVKGFGRLPDGRVEFQPGLTVIRGPNESGKSTEIEAIRTGLYGDGSSSSAKVHEGLRKWNSNGEFLVELELEARDGLHVVTRDFGRRKNSLVQPDGSVITDKRQVMGIIVAKIGLPSLKSYTATACVLQEEASSVCGEPSLSEILEGKITGAGKDPGRILKSIDKERTVILGKSGKTGELAELKSAASEQERQLSEKRDRLDVLVRNKLELSHVEESLGQKTEELKAAEIQCKGHKDYLGAVKALTMAAVSFEAAQEDLENYREAKRVAKESRSKIRELKRQISALEGEIAKGEQYEAADQTCVQLESQVAALEKKVAKATALASKISAKQKKIDGLARIAPKDLRRSRTLAAEIASLRAALDEMVLEVTVTPEPGVLFTMKADGLSVTRKRARAHTKATVEFPGAGSVLVENKTGESKPIVVQIEEKTKTLKEILNGYSLGTVDELEQLHATREAHSGELSRLGDKLEAVLGDEDMPEIEASLRETKGELNKAKRLRNRLKSSALASTEIAKKKANLAACQMQKKENEKLLSESEGALKVLGPSEKTLRTAMEEAATNLGLARKAVTDNETYKCTEAKFARLQVRIEKLEKAVQEMDDRRRELSYGIENATVSQEEVAEAEECLEATKKAIERFGREHRVLTIIRDAVEAAREKAVSGLSGKIEKRIGKILSKVTNGGYTRAKLDGNLAISVYSPSKGDYITVDEIPGAFSTGTLDQVYLAARIALLEALTGDADTPFILDDAFSNFDPERQEQAFSVLETIAEDRQVLYFTCHECPDHLTSVHIGDQAKT